MYPDFHIEAVGSCLALLGDIGSASDDRLFKFIRRQLKQFKYVFFVLGNLEPYQGPDGEKCTHDAAVSKMREFQTECGIERNTPGSPVADRGEFVFLNRGRFDLGRTVTILGCTLFSRISPSQQRTVSIFVSDFSNIAEWTVEKHNTAHQKDLAWLNDEVENIARNEPDRSIVIFTHYSPTNLPEANDPDYIDDPKDVQSAFLTNLENGACCESCCQVSGVWSYALQQRFCRNTDW
jgi:hypothetical protein